MRDQTGECWTWSPRARSKDQAGLLEHALIGGVQPIWLVGPYRPRYIERKRGRGMEHEVHYSHNPLPHPTDLRFARGRQEAPPASSLLHHDDQIRHSASGGPEGFCYPRRPPSPQDPRLNGPSSSAPSEPWPPPPLHHQPPMVCASSPLSLSVSLSLYLSLSCISTQNPCTPFPVLHLDVHLVQK